jgi:hypothetical protein
MKQPDKFANNFHFEKRQKQERQLNFQLPFLYNRLAVFAKL